MIVRGAVHDAIQPTTLPYTMSKATKLPLNSLNDFLACKLCRGYYIDATTIIECLHSFCRSCIVKYLEKNKYCPICDVQVHKTKPLINIRQDKILQSIVYKLVPRLFQNEMLRRKHFYASHPEEKKDLDVEELGEASYQHILAPDENICVALNYKDSPLTPRYLQCSAALSIFHLQKLIRSKYDLSSNHRIDILHGDDVLNSCLTLIDVAYSSLWRRKGPLELTYRIFESTLSPAANINLNSPSNDNISTNNNNNNASNDWKEVQIQISENGEMSVTGIQDCLQLLDNMDDQSNHLKESVKTASNKKDSVNTEDRLDLKPLKNSSKITKVELNQPPSQNSQSNMVDVVMLDTPLLPALTLTVAELKELSKIEEAAKTQASDALPSPPPTKKPKKELPELKSIGLNKMQKKNGAKPTSPQATEKNATETAIIIAKQTINSAVLSIPVNSSSKNVIVTSAIIIPPCSTQEPVTVTTNASTTNSTAVVTSASAVATTTSTSISAMTTLASTVDTTTSTSTVATTTSASVAVTTLSASTVATAQSTVAITTPTAVTTSTTSTTGAVKLSTADTSVAASSSLSSNSSKVPSVNSIISNINNVKTSCTNCSVNTSNTVVITSNTSITTGSGKLTTSVTSVMTSKPIIAATTVASSSSSVNTTTLTLKTSASKRKHPSSTATSATPAVSDHSAAHKLPKPTILNHSLGLQKSLNLSKNHPLTTKHQKAAVETAAKAANIPVNLLNMNPAIQNQASNSKWNAGVSLKSYGTLINVPKVLAQTSQVNKQHATSACTSTATITHLPSAAVTTATASMSDGKQQQVAHRLTSGGQQANIDSGVLMIKSKASTPIGYKTLKDPPKTWNPTLQQTHHNAGGVGPQPGGIAAKPGDLKNVRPAKFFKMRNNMPRYLGCPNSGVKPMFQVHVSPEKEKSNVPETTPTPTQLTTSHTTTPSITTTTTTTTSVASAQSLHLTTPVIAATLPSSPAAPQSIKPGEQQIRKHSIVKIDPKTLKPISEKAPESSNLSTKSTVSGLGSGLPASKLVVVGRGDQPQQGGGLNSCQGKKKDEQEQAALGGNEGTYEQRDLEKGKAASTHQSDQSTGRTHQLASPTRTTTTASATSTSNINLRINTTSVSITNPLKKSPHSPKKSTSPPYNQNHNQSTKSNPSIKPNQTPPSTTSPSINRDKPPQLNQQQLNYTPSNPFIPNPLASPTLNPNQFNFLTAAVAATQGFHHGYDPRYHHHLPYHHQLYPPRLPPFAPPQVGNWWGSAPPASTLAGGQQREQQVPLSGSSANRNSSPRGLIWNGPSADNSVCSPKEAKTATSATMDSKTNLDVLLPRSSSKKEAISISSANNKSIVKETNLIDSAHERKEDNKSKQTSATVKIAMPKEKPLPDVEDKGKIAVAEKANEQATDANKQSKSTSEAQSEKSEKLTQKNTSTDTPKENVVVAVT